MRLEATDRADIRKVWLTDPEVEELRRHVTSTRDDLIIQLGAFVGLRSFEIPQVQPTHVERTSDGEHYRLHVPESKDTKNGDGKPHDAYLPRGVERDLHRYQQEANIALNDPYVNLTPAGVRDVVKRTATRVANATGNNNWEYVNSHDLGRRYAQHPLVDQQMNPRVVMAVGGLDSLTRLSRTSTPPSEQIVNDTFAAVGIGM